MFEQNNKLYDKLHKDLIRTNINGLDIMFDSKWKRIGVNLSGGADSCLLTYLLCKIISDNNLDTKIDVITYQRCWETRPWQGYVSLEVYNYLCNLFPNILANRYTTFIPPELEHGAIGPIINGRSVDQVIVGSFNKFASWNYNLDAVFNATSKNPDDTRSDRMQNRDKDAADGKLIDLWIYANKLNTVFAHPFRFVKKDWIVAQYHIFEILDLYNTTRSCEGDINHNHAVSDVCKDFTEYSDGMHIPICNECWWCEERTWAESQVENVIKEIYEL